jgi:hypothetical protein
VPFIYNCEKSLLWADKGIFHIKPVYYDSLLDIIMALKYASSNKEEFYRNVLIKTGVGINYLYFIEEPEYDNLVIIGNVSYQNETGWFYVFEENYEDELEEYNDAEKCVPDHIIKALSHAMIYAEDVCGCDECECLIIGPVYTDLDCTKEMQTKEPSLFCNKCKDKTDHHHPITHQLIPFKTTGEIMECDYCSEDTIDVDTPFFECKECADTYTLCQSCYDNNPDHKRHGFEIQYFTPHRMLSIQELYRYLDNLECLNDLDWRPVVAKHLSDFPS